MAGDSLSDLEVRRFRDDEHRGAPPRGARQLTAILPNGRTVWLEVGVPLAPAAAVEGLARVAAAAGERRALASAGQREAIDRLAATLAADIDRVEQARLERVDALRRTMLAADLKLDRRLARARDELHARIDKQLKIDRENIRRLRRRDLWDTILIATSLPLYAAYGQPGELFGVNNLTLLLSSLIFLAGDEVVEAVFGGDQGSSDYALQDADVWSYLAPFANVAAAWWLLSDQQHERFITGVTRLELEGVHAHATHRRTMYHYRANVDLRRRVALDYVADFESYADVPVVATIGSLVWTPAGAQLHARVERLTAHVDEGVLKLEFYVIPARGWKRRPYPTELGHVDVAWMVDTRQPTPAAPAA